MKRILLKLSGEALAGEKKTGFDEETVRKVALQVKELVDDGIQVGIVIGNITATSAAIAGAVKGDIDVQGPVILDSSAIVMGNIKSKSVQINNGAVIEGCSQCYAEVSPTSFFDDYKPEKKKTK